jgi:hypothetical protein
MTYTANQRLTDQINKFWGDPLGYVMFIFPWDTDESIQMVELEPEYRDRFPGCKYGPDKWACEFLDDMGKEIRKNKFNGRDTVPPLRFSTASGHGIGKSTLVSWLIMFIMDTRPYSMGVVTANTGEQLRTKTWAELAKWHSRALTSHFWNYTSGKGSMSLYRLGSGDVTKKWRVDAMTCREENSEAFQGLHAANATPFYIFDEASGIPDKIWEARFGGATDGEPMSFDFGNPTRKSGYFFENCAGRFRHRYNTRHIDSRSVKLTNKPLMEEWKEDWGEDSDLFKVKVKGEFPAAGSVQFIGTDIVIDAMLRDPVTTKHDKLVIGVDVARFGDNNTVLYPRIGNDARSFDFKSYNGLDVVQVAEKVIEMVNEFKALGHQNPTLFVDGGGLGGGVVDILRRLGYNPIDVNFGGKSADRKWWRKGDEMWGRMKEAIPRLSIPNNVDLRDQLTQREYGFSQDGQRIKLETKADMVKRGVDSPDIADALALTFAAEIATFDERIAAPLANPVQWDYDPLDMRN